MPIVSCEHCNDVRRDVTNTHWVCKCGGLGGNLSDMSLAETHRNAERREDWRRAVECGSSKICKYCGMEEHVGFICLAQQGVINLRKREEEDRVTLKETENITVSDSSEYSFRTIDFVNEPVKKDPYHEHELATIREIIKIHGRTWYGVLSNDLIYRATSVHSDAQLKAVFKGDRIPEPKELPDHPWDSDDVEYEL